MSALGSLRCIALIVAVGLLYPAPAHANTLVAGHADWQPWCSKNPAGQKGVLIDIFNLACRRAGYRCETLVMPLPRRNTVAWGDSVNVELGVIPEWREEYSRVSVYTIPVIQTVNVVIARCGRMPKTDAIDAFYGKTIGTNRGYTYTDGFDEAFAGGRIRREDTIEGRSIVLMLVHDRFDAAILDRHEARFWFKTLNIDERRFEEVYVFKQPNDLRFRLHSDLAPLLPRLDQTLRAMQADGSLQQIVDAYTRSP